MHALCSKTPRVSWAYLRPLLNWLCRHGYDVSALLAQCQLSPLDWQDGASRLSAPDYLHCWQAAMRIVGDPHLGLAVGSYFDLATYGNLAGALMTCQRAGEALDLVLANEHMLQDLARCQLRQRGKQAWITFNFAYGNQDELRPLVEKEMAELIAAARFFFRFEDQASIRPMQLYFRHPRPLTWRRYFSVFGEVELHFAAEFDGACFDASLLDKQLRFSSGTAVADTLQLLQGKAPGNIQAALIAKVRDSIRQQLPRGATHIDQVAEDLHLSRRTLQRQLSEAQTCFLRLIDEVRSEQALRLLDQGELSTEEIAYRVGFSDARGFRLAFRRWMDLSPEQYRSAQEKI